MYEDIAFGLIELGHSPDAIMAYELPMFLGYAIKKMQRHQAPEEYKPAGGWQTQGSKRKKIVTSDEMLKKVRRQRNK